jgi:hypothetical protein
MGGQSLLDHVSSILESSRVTEGGMQHAPSGTHLLRHQATTGLTPTAYRPLLCLVLQGAKDVGSSTRTLTVRAGQSLVVSHALPVVSRITEATPERPYVALVRMPCFATFSSARRKRRGAFWRPSPPARSTRAF